LVNPDVQFPEGVTHPFVDVPGHVPGREPGGQGISATENISRPITARNTNATIIKPATNTREYRKNVPTNPANVFELDAAKNAVPVQRPSITPPPLLLPLAIYVNARKKRLRRLKGAQLLSDKE
jgi:hypothetical protein